MVRCSLCFLCKYVSPFHREQRRLRMSKKKKGKPTGCDNLWLDVYSEFMKASQLCCFAANLSAVQFQNDSVVVGGRRRLQVKATEGEDPAVAPGLRMTFHCTCFVCVKPHLRQRLDAVLCSSFISTFPP